MISEISTTVVLGVALLTGGMVTASTIEFADAGVLSQPVVMAAYTEERRVLRGNNNSHRSDSSNLEFIVSLMDSLGPIRRIN